MTHVPLHARSATVAQTIMGRGCAQIVPAPPEVVPVHDDREFFVAAWCLHPRLISDEESIFIPEPGARVPGDALDLRVDEPVLHGFPGLCYRVRLRIVECQDWNMPPPSSEGGGSLAVTQTTTTRMTATSTDGTPAWTDAMTIRADLVYAGSLTPMMMLHVLVGDARPPSCRDSASPSAPLDVRLSPSNGLWSEPARWSGPPHHRRNRPYPQHTLPDTRPTRSPCHSCWTTQSTLGHRRPISPPTRCFRTSVMTPISSAVALRLSRNTASWAPFWAQTYLFSRPHGRCSW